MVLATRSDLRQLQDILDESAARHGRLCPRQVLGVRIGLAAMEALGIEYTHEGRELLAIVETDGCFVSGVEVATGCSVGHRTLRVHDYGKVAGVFVEVSSERAIRVVPRADVRARANRYAPDEPRRYYAQMLGYQVMPASELLEIQPVRLRDDLAEILGQRGVRVDCAECGEEVMNRREVRIGHAVLCRACADGAYFAPVTGGS